MIHSMNKGNSTRGIIREKGKERGQDIYPEILVRNVC